MSTDPDQILNRLVGIALTIFVTVSLMLAALIAREIWLQQRIADLGASVQASLEDLDDTTVEIQSELSEIRAAADDAEKVETLGEVAELLTDVDERLGTIEEGIAGVAAGLEGSVEGQPISGQEDASPDSAAPEAVSPAGAAADEVEELHAMQDRADQVFAIFAILLGLAALVIALLLGFAMRVQERLSLGEGHPADPM